MLVIGCFEASESALAKRWIQYSWIQKAGRVHKRSPDGKVHAQIRNWTSKALAISAVSKMWLSAFMYLDVDSRCAPQLP